MILVVEPAIEAHEAWSDGAECTDDCKLTIGGGLAESSFPRTDGVLGRAEAGRGGRTERRETRRQNRGLARFLTTV